MTYDASSTTSHGPGRDVADQLSEAVEGQRSPDAAPDFPRRVAPPSVDEKYDRSAIIGHDGRVAAGWALRFIIVVVALYLAGKVAGYIWVILLPIIMALIVSTVMWPTARFLRSIKFPGAAAAAVAILGFLAIIGGVFAAMAPVIRNQGGQIIDQASAGIDQITAWLKTNPFGLNTDEFNLDQLVQDAINFLRDQSQNIVMGVSAGVNAATSFAVGLFLTLLISFFMLKDGPGFLPMIRRYTGTSTGWHLSEALTRSWNTLSGYIRTQALVSFIDAVLIGLGLWFLGIPLAFVLAVITFFAGFIPIVGALSAGVLSVVIALVINGPVNALLVLVLIVAVQQIEGNVLQPILQSKAMNLHAAVVLLSVTLGSTLFGIVGAFLAVPVAAVLGVWIRYHSEMVALRAGEITIEDVEIATAQGKSPSSREAFHAVREHLKGIATRKATSKGSVAASKAYDDAIAEPALDSNSPAEPKHHAD
ncbi:AI-2E family transporter [Corynebacterium uterequi]|nr:AI-2E family transporter [Corynebacterium uterequi]